LASNDISILLYILNTLPVSVSAQGVPCVYEGIYDNVHLNLLFPDHILAHIHASWLDPDQAQRMTVLGSKKKIVYNDKPGQEKIKIFNSGLEVPPFANTFSSFMSDDHYGDIEIPNIRYVDPLLKECQNFVQVILENDVHCRYAFDGLRVIKILEAAQHSLSNGNGRAPIKW
jgi:predicted dehydrogenase